MPSRRACPAAAGTLAFFACLTLRCQSSAPPPPPPAAVATPLPTMPAAPSEEAPGRQLVERAVAAMGGAEAVDGVRTLELKGNAKRIFPGGQETKFESSTTIQFSGAVRQDLDLAFGRLTTVWTPQGAFTDMGSGPVLLPDVQRAELEAGFRRNLVALLQARKHSDFHAFHRGEVSVGGVAAEEVEVHSGGQATTLAIDRSTGRILRTRSVSPMEARSGKRETVSEYSDYRNADGLVYPFAATTSLGGQPAAAIQLQSVRVNAPVEAALFEPSTAPVPAEGPVETSPTPAASPTPQPTAK